MSTEQGTQTTRQKERARHARDKHVIIGAMEETLFALEQCTKEHEYAGIYAARLREPLEELGRSLAKKENA